MPASHHSQGKGNPHELHVHVRQIDCRDIPPMVPGVAVSTPSQQQY